ncbi:putative transcription factor C3H family [Helianthus annuus]|nr:putative transcription factor C3H family [Helianthus annuus]
MYHNNSNNLRIESRMELPHESRSPFRYSITPVKVEEDVVVLDGDIVNSLPVERSRSLSLSLTDSSGSSSSGGKSYKTELCVSYLQNSGFCRYGSKCQFAHGTKELHPVPFSYKSMAETPCKNYSLSGTCSFGSKCRFLHHETSTPPSSTTRTISQIKPDEPTSSTVNLKSSNWSPMDDDIEIQLKGDFDSYANKVLYGPQRRNRLPAFTQICPE